MDHRCSCAQEQVADHSTAHCEKCAQHLEDKVTRIHSDLDATVDAGPVGVSLAPVCSL